MVGDTGIPRPNVNIHVTILHNEGMLQQLLILWPVLVVFKQAVPDKGAKFCGEALVWWKARRILLNHFSQHLKLGLAVFVGELAGGQLDQGDPQAPHVSPDVVVWLVLVEKTITKFIFVDPDREFFTLFGVIHNIIPNFGSGPQSAIDISCLRGVSKKNIPF